MKCHDCQSEKVEFKFSTEKEDFYKCKECFAKDSTLRNYQKCDVYSRVVGYMSPLDRWNVGKKREWEDRKTFKV